LRVPRLVDTQPATTGQSDVRQAPPPLVDEWALDRDSLGLQLRYRGLDVIAEQEELVTCIAGFGWMDGELCGWEREDQPAATGVNCAKPEHILKEAAVRIGVAAVDDRVGPVDHLSEIVVAAESSAAEVVPAAEVVVASSEIVAAEVTVVSAVALARAGRCKRRDEAAQRRFAAVRTDGVGRRIALKQRGRPLPALLAAVLINRHYRLKPPT
jgi:hypothetical protein